MTKTMLSVVDAFTRRPFAGNPAAVCVLAEMPDDQWMHLVAREMALSETAFVVPQKDGGWALRWFTPVVEVDLCGHATLAAAHVLWEKGHISWDQPVVFETRSGQLMCRSVGDEIEMDFPVSEVTEAPEVVSPLAVALGCPLASGQRTQFDVMGVMTSASQLRAVTPDHTALARLSAQLGVRGIIITSPSDDPTYHFLSRFFAPACGVLEDPVTGSAHCALGPYWGKRLGLSDLEAYQASVRGGRVGISLRGDRVLLRGHAVRVSEVELFH